MGRKLFGNEENRSWWQLRDRENKEREERKQDSYLLTRISLRTITDIEIGRWSCDTRSIILTRIRGTDIVLFRTSWTSVSMFTATGEIVDP